MQDTFLPTSRSSILVCDSQDFIDAGDTCLRTHGYLLKTRDSSLMTDLFPHLMAHAAQLLSQDREGGHVPEMLPIAIFRDREFIGTDCIAF